MSDRPSREYNGGKSSAYRYWPNGRSRFAPKSSEPGRHPLRRSLIRLAEFNASDKIVRHYLSGLGPNEVLAIDQSAPGAGAATETAWAFHDYLGSVAAWGKYSGGAWTLQHQTFDAFGNLDAALSTPAASALQVAGKPLPQIWAGHQFDASVGLYYMHARWYDPRTGKFISQVGLCAGRQDLEDAEHLMNGLAEQSFKLAEAWFRRRAALFLAF